MREFVFGEMRVEAVFQVPELTLAGVMFTLPRNWTKEQVSAALEAFGGGWKHTERNYSPYYVNAEGATAT